MTEHKHDKLVDIQETVKLFKIFSDYTRLRIIELLYKIKSRNKICYGF